MRQRLAGPFPYQPLDRFASVLEPVKGYARHAEKYTSTTPLNRLVDSIAPESDAARAFRDEVDHYLAAPKDRRNAKILRQQLAMWQEDAAAVRPMLEGNSILTENLPVADALAVLCKTGEEALDYLDGTKQRANPDWKQRSLSVVEGAGKRHGDILLPIAPGIAALIQAVAVS